MYSIVLQQTKIKGQFNFTHRHAFGTTGGDKIYGNSIAKQAADQIKRTYPTVFKEPYFPIDRENQPLFEHRIPLKDPQQPPPHRKIYPLYSEELSVLKQNIEKLLATNRIRPSDSPYRAPILLQNIHMVAFTCILIAMRLIKIQLLACTFCPILMKC